MKVSASADEELVLSSSSRHIGDVEQSLLKLAAFLASEGLVLGSTSLTDVIPGQKAECHKDYMVVEDNGR